MTVQRIQLHVYMCVSTLEVRSCYIFLYPHCFFQSGEPVSGVSTK